MKKTLNLMALAVGVVLGLAGGTAMAESQYGYGTGTVTATARVNLSVTVPRLILLRVGGTTAGGDTLNWTSGFAVSTAPTAPTTGNNLNATWDSTAPTATVSANPAALPVTAWTNSSGGGSLSYTATDFGTGGPTLGNISVSSTGLAHPAPAALAASSTTSVTFTPTTVATGNWTYSLGGTPASWRAGTYTSMVTYTATSL